MIGIRSALHAVGRAYVRRIVESEFLAQRFEGYNERPAEYAFVFRQLGARAPKSVLDVGTGTTALPALMRSCGCTVTAIDNVRDYWPTGMTNRHWHVTDDNIVASKITNTFDMVTCISVIEHVRDHVRAVHSMIRLLRAGGHLVLTCPYTEREFVEDTYRAPGADERAARLPFICRSYSRRELDAWLTRGGGSEPGELVHEEFWKGFTGRHWMVGDRIAPPQPATHEDHNLGFFVIRRRAVAEAGVEVFDEGTLLAASRTSS